MPGADGVARLVGRVVGDFGLIEVGAAMVAVPQDLELLMMLDEEAVDGDVVAVDDEAVGAEVAGPADAGAVVGAPDPGVIDDGVVGVDAEIDLARPTPAPPTRKKTSWRKMGFLAWRGVAALRADFDAGRERFVSPASKRSPAISMPSASAVVMAAVPLMGRSVAKPRPMTTVSGRVMRMGSVRS